MAALAWARAAWSCSPSQRLRLLLGLRRWCRRPPCGWEGRPPARCYYLAAERILRPVTALALAVAPAERHGRARRARPADRRLGAGHRRAAAGRDRRGRGRVSQVRRGHRVPGGRGGVPGRGGQRPGVVATMFVAKAIADPVLVGAPRAGADRARRAGRVTCRWTTAARSACSRPASTGWPRACASASASATCSAARWARTWRAGRCVEGTIRLGGEEREIGALFVDISGSTSMAWPCRRPRWCACSTASSAWWSRWWRPRARIVNKFEGDAALCVFGAPVPRDDPAGRRAARRPRAGRPPDPRRAARSTSASASRRASRWPATWAPSTASSTR